MVSSKVRIYDLAKELKLDSKRLIEEVRREGVDASVPSNSIPKELADKIRSKYFPKKETTAARTVRVVKKAARPHLSEESGEEGLAETHAGEDAETSDYPSVLPPAEMGAPAAAPPAETQTARPMVARVIKKLAPAARAEQPTALPASPAEAITESPFPFVDEGDEAAEELPSGDEAGVLADGTDGPLTDERPSPMTEQIPSGLRPAAPFPAGTRQIKVLRPTAAALSAGIRHGDRAPAAPPPAPPTTNAPPRGDRDRGGERRPHRGDERPRNAEGRTEHVGTPGETATPQTTYIPP
ncbi:MAG TPA: translation initiation factor IF-2 N-terminal domain-containing protein, partial [Pyrinomonadaceae bacterium]|nr:translation initiation factor IF-2 N-terminal domain-containing protein [Pyrinomonadaceae bacterium]